MGKQKEHVKEPNSASSLANQTCEPDLFELYKDQTGRITKLSSRLTFLLSSFEQQESLKITSTEQLQQILMILPENDRIPFITNYREAKVISSTNTQDPINQYVPALGLSHLFESFIKNIEEGPGQNTSVLTFAEKEMLNRFLPADYAQAFTLLEKSNKKGKTGLEQLFRFALDLYPKRQDLKTVLTFFPDQYAVKFYQYASKNFPAYALDLNRKGKLSHFHDFYQLALFYSNSDVNDLRTNILEQIANQNSQGKISFPITLTADASLLTALKQLDSNQKRRQFVLNCISKYSLRNLKRRDSSLYQQIMSLIDGKQQSTSSTSVASSDAQTPCNFWNHVKKTTTSTVIDTTDDNLKH
jgi:hypothetical protein